MRIKKIRVRNYKGFLDSGAIELGDKWNVIVGQNNSGKSSLIECFGVNRFQNRPHKAESQAVDHVRPEISEVDIDVVFSGAEIRRGILRQGGQVIVPIAKQQLGDAEARAALDAFLSREEIELHLTFGGGTSTFANRRTPSHGLFPPTGQTFAAVANVSASKTIEYTHTGMNGNDSIPAIGRSLVSESIFMLDAQRFSLGRSGVSETRILESNARNLAAVLQVLHANPDRYKEYNQNVSTIFPSIKWVSVVPFGTSECEVRIWTVPTKSGRDDLMIPLSECGTGVGQVLAILYAAMNYTPGVIAIDEPNSFLNPGAARKLVQILKRYDPHQYIISSHSGDVIAASQPAMLHIVSLADGESSVQSFGETTVDSTRMMLEEVGASLSDVFGAERVVWVEGPTERECFDLIVRRCFAERGVGLAVVALRNTGDFEGDEKSARATLEIYSSLSRGGAILPVSVTFSFDREGKSEQDITDLQRRCGGQAHVLPRRMTENYLLHAGAIATVMTDLGESNINVDQIEALISKFGPECLPERSKASVGSPEFFVEVHGAKLLKAIFYEASECRQEYRKVRDGVALLRTLLEVAPDVIGELIDYVGNLAPSATQAEREQQDQQGGIVGAFLIP